MNLNHLISQCLPLFVTWSIDAFALFTASSTFAFLLCLLFICRIRCLIDFCFLSFGRFVYRFASSFLTTVGCTLLIASTVCFRSVYAIVICCLVYRILSCCHCFIDFRFSFCFFFVCRVWCLVDFRFLSFRRFINRRFCFVFLNNRWLDIVNESKPFDFAVSTPSLFVAWSIDAFALFTASSTFAFLSLPSLHLSHQVFDRFLS